jgi:hypothetical protein
MNFIELSNNLDRAVNLIARRADLLTEEERIFVVNLYRDFNGTETMVFDTTRSDEFNRILQKFNGVEV